jgi:hypothetical protein
MVAIDTDRLWNDALAIVGETLARHVAKQEAKRPHADELPTLHPSRYGEQGEGVYDPADITEEVAAAMLSVATRYVAKHSKPWDPSHHNGKKQHHTPMSEADQDDAVGRILAHVLTRDYTAAGIGQGCHARAFWQSCSLHRRSGWRGMDNDARKTHRRATSETPLERSAGMQASASHNPAAIAIAIEEATRRGVYYSSVSQRGARRKPRRELGRHNAGKVDAQEAAEALRAYDPAPRYSGHAEQPQRLTMAGLISRVERSPEPVTYGQQAEAYAPEPVDHAAAMERQADRLDKMLAD